MVESTENVTAAAIPKEEPPASMHLADFLQGTGPSVWRTIDDLWILKQQQYSTAKILATPDLILDCQNQLCGGPRTFRIRSGERDFGSAMSISTFLNYVCSNCSIEAKRFSVMAIRATDIPGEGQIYKYGESPPFGPKTPARLIRLFGADKDLFLKGRRSETQGLGIGAFSYYRRVVESHKDQIFDEVIRVSEAVGLPAEKLETLKRGKAEVQFTKALETVKDAMPETLLINGQNPFTLLHGALSSHLHERTDDECLELAHAVRVVLIELADKMSAALKDEAELSDAVKRLMKTRE